MATGNRLLGVELFATGTWNDKTFTLEDLQQIVDSFIELSERVKPYLKLGHDEKQALLQEDGLPAAGWITNLYIVGNKLLADFEDVPKIIYELIKAKAYKRVSCEIYINYKATPEETGKDEKTYPKVLKAVALLGGDTPAVTTLHDVMALYAVANDKKADAVQILEYTLKEDYKVNEEELKKLEADIAAKQADVNEKLAVFTTDKTALESEKVELAKQQDALKTQAIEVEKYKSALDLLSQFKDKEDLEKFVADVRAKDAAAQETQKKAQEVIDNQKVAEIKSFIEAKVKEDKILPAQRNMLEKILLTLRDVNTVLTFTNPEVYNLKSEMTVYETVVAFVNTIPDLGLLKRHSASDSGLFRSADEERKALERKYMEDNKCTYAQAQRALSVVRKDLYEA